MSYFMNHLRVDKCNGKHLNYTDAYHLFMSILTSNAKEKGKRVLRQNDQKCSMQSFRNKAVKNTLYHTWKNSWTICGEQTSTKAEAMYTLTSKPWWMEEDKERMNPYLKI